VTVADLEGDGSLELVVSAFGTIGLGGAPSGEVKVYARGAGLAMWTEREVVIPSSAGVKFPNQTRALDLDGDRDLDLIVPYGFLVCTAIPGGAPCGGLSWYERTPSGWTPHAIVPAGAELFYHGVDVVDFDGDGRLDLVTVGERAQDALRGRPAQAQAQWFKGVAGPARFETTPRIIGEGLGSFPQVIDLDGDGDLDVVSAEFFTDASFAWFERTAAPSAADPAGRFTRHVIDRDSGPSIMLRVVDDLFGDGIRRVLGSNHSNTARLRPDPWPSAVYVLDPPMDPRQPWTKRAISTGITSARGSLLAPQAAPGIFGVGDLDGDGDLDVAVAGDGDPKVYWLEQTSRGQFTTHVLEAMLSQAGGMQVVDLDGDGRREIVVTGYDANVVYVYARR